MDKEHDKNLLKELKKAYEYYIVGDVQSFDRTVEGVILTFAGNAKQVSNDIEEALRGEITFDRKRARKE